MNKGEPNADQRQEKPDTRQESMAVGSSEWQRDRDLTDDTLAESEEESGSLPPETPVNYRQRP